MLNLFRFHDSEFVLEVFYNITVDAKVWFATSINTFRRRLNLATAFLQESHLPSVSRLGFLSLTLISPVELHPEVDLIE